MMLLKVFIVTIDPKLLKMLFPTSDLWIVYKCASLLMNNYKTNQKYCLYNDTEILLKNIYFY